MPRAFTPSPPRPPPSDADWMALALRLARKGYGTTSPNPMVGALLVRGDRLIGQGWHRRAGGPHAEIEALQDAERRGQTPRGATLYVTLEPCSTHGRTPPCTDAIRSAGIRRVVIAAADPNPLHHAKASPILRRAGITVTQGILAAESARLNEAFNHWIVHRTPFVTVKAAMTLDGKIATVSGESQWITSPESRRHAMRLRQGSDAILVGIGTVLADDPALTPRRERRDRTEVTGPVRRVVVDSRARTPLTAQLLTDAFASWTTVVVTRAAPRARVAALKRRATVWVAPTREGRVDLPWVLRRLGAENVTALLVEGGGEMNASFLLGGLAHRVAFYYAPKIIGGDKALRAVAGPGATRRSRTIPLCNLEWRRTGPDLFLTALTGHPPAEA